MVALYLGWQIAAQTVIQLVQQNAQIAALQQQLQRLPATPAVATK
jgi:cell division protein FtsB